MAQWLEKVGFQTHPLRIRIYQLSNRLGRGAPATVTLQF